MQQRHLGEIWSTLFFSQENPPAWDLTLWQAALTEIALQGHFQDRLGRFVERGHKIWAWQYDEESKKLYHLKGMAMDVYNPSQVPRYTHHPNCWTLSCLDQPNTAQGQICTVKEMSPHSTVHNIICYVDGSLDTPCPTTFWQVLIKWQHTWMWENLSWIGDNSWIAEAIADNLCITVTNGSCMADSYPQTHADALVIECTKGRGQMWCSFPKQAINAGNYLGELADLMRIHLLLLTTNEVHPGLRGSVIFYSDSLSGLDKVQHLPPYRIPSCCQHFDILKNIMVNCSNLSFTRHCKHVKAHQDNSTEYHLLPLKSKLNCAMNYNAKTAIRTLATTSLPCQKFFPLEPMCTFVGQHKLTANMSNHLEYWVHLKLVQSTYHSLGILDSDQFELVDWEMVHNFLPYVPKLFQLWVCKQLTNIAATYANICRWDKLVTTPRCPSCLQVPETCAHKLFCFHSGQVETLLHSIDLIKDG